jgi:hypothetical protein
MGDQQLERFVSPFKTKTTAGFKTGTRARTEEEATYQADSAFFSVVKDA